MYKIAIITQASINIGLGHYHRSYKFVEKIATFFKDVSIDYIINTDLVLELPNIPDVSPNICSTFNGKLYDNYHIIFLDMIECELSQIQNFRKMSNLLISLSPIFNHFEFIDILFTRENPINISTRTEFTNIKIFHGPEYALLGRNVKRISEDNYCSILNRDKFSLGICMGGTDPENLTLQIIKKLYYWEKPALIWLAIGYYYPHDISLLREQVLKDNRHEIVIATTHHSLWDVMSNCSLVILQGGLTTYESIFAGLPSINIPKNSNSSFLLNSIVTNSLGWALDSIDELKDYNIFENICEDKSTLYKMHKNCKEYLDDDSSIRIFNKCIELLN